MHSRNTRQTYLVVPIWVGALAVALCLMASLATPTGAPRAEAASAAMSPASASPTPSVAAPHQMHIAIVMHQASPTPTFAPVAPSTGRWRGTHIRFTVSGDARYLPDGSAYTPCGWTVWQRLVPVSVDGLFEVIMPEGAVRGRFVSPEVCEGTTSGWRDVDGQWCQESVSWIAYPLSATPTSTPFP